MSLDGSIQAMPAVSAERVQQEIAVRVMKDQMESAKALVEQIVQPLQFGGTYDGSGRVASASVPSIDARA